MASYRIYSWECPYYISSSSILSRSSWSIVTKNPYDVHIFGQFQLTIDSEMIEGKFWDSFCDRIALWAEKGKTPLRIVLCCYDFGKDGVIRMVYLILAMLLIGLLSPSKQTRQHKKKSKSRPWYDITVDDMIKYDLFFDD